MAISENMRSLEVVDINVNWPMLDDIGLSESAIRIRRSYIGGSDANAILSGDAGRLLDLWREKTGVAKPVDLSGVLPVMMGSWTEASRRRVQAFHRL